MGVRHFEVVAKHLVVADFEARDFRALDLLRLIVGDPLLAAAEQFAQLVQLGVVAGADEVAVAARQRQSSARPDSSRLRSSGQRSNSRSSRQSRVSCGRRGGP